jgi:ACS family sodium-dependent inorganic phosphate cotransporter
MTLTARQTAARRATAPSPCGRPQPGRRRAAPPPSARVGATRGGGNGGNGAADSHDERHARSPTAAAAVADQQQQQQQPTRGALLSLRRRLVSALPPALTSLASDAQEAAAAAAKAAAAAAGAGGPRNKQQQQQQQAQQHSSPPSWGLRLGFLSGGAETDEQQSVPAPSSIAPAAAAASPSPSSRPPSASPPPPRPAEGRQQQQQQQQQQPYDVADAESDAAASPSSPSSSPSSSLLAPLEQYWSALPSRHRVVFGAALAFVVCNMDKVNMSVAIIPMAQEYGWSAGVAGLVQSAFFWGYILCQLPGGYLASAVGGRAVMPAGVGLWSLATAAVPLLAGTVPGLCAARAAVGLGEAVAPSAATDMVARVVPAGERSRAVAFVFGGLHVGSVLGLLAAPVLIERLGWESVFVSFGGAGLLWCVWFERLMAEIREADPDVAARLVGDGVAGAEAREAAAAAAVAAAVAADAASSSSSSSSSSLLRPASPSAGTTKTRHNNNANASASAPGAAAAAATLPRIPYRAFLRARSVRALAYAHFCNNWFHYTMLAWLPTYFTSALDADLGSAARTALLPPLAGIAASALAGPLADGLVARGWPVSRVRKLAQGAAFVVPSLCLLAASALAGGVGSPADDGGPWAARLTVALITAGLGASSFSLAGLYCTHQDLSPKYSSAMLGLTNTAGAVPGIVGVAATGWLYDATGSWADALFLPTVFFLLTGAAVYTAYGSNEAEDFDAPGLDAPFAAEAPLRRAAARAARALLPESARARVVEVLGLEVEADEAVEMKER